MLTPAFKHEKELAKLWAEKVIDPHYRFWDEDMSYHPLSGILNSNYRKDEWVSVEDGKVVGYFCALVDKGTRNVEDISVASFTPSKQFGYDFIRFIRYMARRYQYVRWAAVDGHPQEKHYLAILKHFNGRVVGVFKKKIKLLDGKLYDEKWYEIDNQIRHAS